MNATQKTINLSTTEDLSKQRTLLHIDASARSQRSLSRHLSQKFLDQWQKHCPHDSVLRRDLGKNPPPAITENWIGAAFTPASARSTEQARELMLSDELIAEVESADLIILGTPMYNYGMPAALKAWFDQVIRINKTFNFDLARGDYPLAPILKGKTLVLLTASGEFGFAPGGIRERENHLVPHIQTCSKYLGVDTEQDFYHIGIEYQEFGDDRHQQSIQKAQEAIPALLEKLIAANKQY
ncbi:UNVERIFIED_CONTAM: FMN-dependent NADH-azoreductase [Euhalothece sp. KZN 001]